MKEWRIWAQSDELGPDVDYWVVADALLEKLAQFDVSGVVGWGQVDSTIGAVFTVESNDPMAAVELGLSSFIEALDTITDVGMGTFEIGGEDSEPTPLVGATDIGEMFGVTRQRVYQLIKERPDFPSPTGKIARGNVWDKRAVIAWRNAEHTRQ